jgi:hypothetical protein
VIPKALLVGAGVLMLVMATWASLERAGKLKAEGRADTAAAELVTCGLGAAIDKSSARAAVDALEQVKQDRAESAQRCALALQEGQAREAAYRAQLGRCTAPEAVADRMGELFP